MMWASQAAPRIQLLAIRQCWSQEEASYRTLDASLAVSALLQTSASFIARSKTCDLSHLTTLRSPPPCTWNLQLVPCYCASHLATERAVWSYTYVSGVIVLIQTLRDFHYCCYLALFVSLMMKKKKSSFWNLDCICLVCTMQWAFLLSSNY